MCCGYIGISDDGIIWDFGTFGTCKWGTLGTYVYHAETLNVVFVTIQLMSLDWYCGHFVIALLVLSFQRCQQVF